MKKKWRIERTYYWTWKYANGEFAGCRQTEKKNEQRHRQRQSQKAVEKEKIKAKGTNSSSSPRPSDSKGKGKGRPSPICFRCGKKGHLSKHCTNQPQAKRKRDSDSANVIIDMSPWAEEFAQWRKYHEEETAAAASGGMASGLVPDVPSTDAFAKANADAAAMAGPEVTDKTPLGMFVTCNPKITSGLCLSKIPSANIISAPPPSPSGGPSSAGWNINIIFPFR